MAVDPQESVESGDSEGSKARAVAVLQHLGYTCLPPATLAKERDSAREVLLVDRLVAALKRLNPGLSQDHVLLALRELTGTRATDLAAASQRTYGLLTQGLGIAPSGRSRRPRTVRYLDWQQPANNEFVVTWQLPVRGVQRQVVADLVAFVNGIPLVVMMCQPAPPDPAWQGAALAELLRWQEADPVAAEPGVPRLFESVHLVVALGEPTAVYGSVLTPPHHFAPWRSPGPGAPGPGAALWHRPPTAQDLLLLGMLTPPRLLDLLQNFVAFPRDPATGRPARTLCRDPEYRAVQRAAEQTLGPQPAAAPADPLRPEAPAGGGVGGVIWHAAGDSDQRQHLMMGWLAGKLHRDSRLQGRPVILVVADRPRALALAQTLREVGQAAATEVSSGAELQQFLGDPQGQTLVTTGPLVRTLLDPNPSHPAAAAWLNQTAAPFCPVVLISDVLGDRAAGLAVLMRRALPGACLLGFTSTPLADRDTQTPATLGPRLATFSFAQAIAEKAAVPVYFDALPQPLGSPGLQSERVHFICQQVRGHFLRVVRPGGGQAQLLVGSAAEARLYQQTLDRLGGLLSGVYDETGQGARPGSELYIGCQPLLSDGALPMMQAVYLATPVGGLTLLQAVLSVNATAKEKLFGLVVDSVATASGQPAALGEFAAADVEAALQRPTDELPRLQEGHRAALKLLSGAQNLYSLEQCLAELATAPQRGELQAAFRRCGGALELLLGDRQAQGFVAELRWLGQVLLAAAARYRDDRLSLTGCGARVRRLVDEAVVRDGNQRQVQRVELWSPALDDKLAALSPSGQASELLNALHYEIGLRFAADPAFFAAVRAELSRLLAEPQPQRPELVVTQLLALRARLASRLGRPQPEGLSTTARVLYEVLTGVAELAAAESRLSYGAPLEPICRALAVQLAELLAARLAAGSSGPAAARHAELHHIIAEHLQAAGFAADRAALLAGQAVQRLT